MTILSVFARCVESIREGALIVRESSKDKEFHFQNWFKKRLQETGLNFDHGGRNSYPDFRMVKFTEGYELKGLAYYQAREFSQAAVYRYGCRIPGRENLISVNEVLYC